MAVDIIIYRHGQDDPKYDCNWEEVASETWHEVERFNCVDAVERFSKSFRSDTTTFGSEQERIEKRFYIRVSKQDKLANFDIRNGDYIREMCCFGKWWKILGNVEVNDFGNCYYIFLYGERLTGREMPRKLLEKDEITI